jgi:hypothetical protein
MSNQQRFEALGPSVPYPQVLAVWADAPGAASSEMNNASVAPASLHDPILRLRASSSTGDPPPEFRGQLLTRNYRQRPPEL